jgi:hypothetical protein
VYRFSTFRRRYLLFCEVDVLLPPLADDRSGVPIIRPALLLTSVFLVAPPPFVGRIGFPGRAYEVSMLAAGFFLSGFPAIWTGRQRIPCEVLIATAMPGTFKPLSHREFRCGALLVGTLHGTH